MTQYLPKDVQVYHSWTKVSNSVRVTHIPTGLKAEAHGVGYFKTRNEAMALLEEKLADQNSQPQ